MQAVLNDAGRAVKSSRILMLGKKIVDAVRKSPALDIIHLLEEKGAHIYYLCGLLPTRRHGDGQRYRY